MRVSPGLAVTDDTLVNRGTLSLIVKRGSDAPPIPGADPTARYLLSVAHVIARGSINQDACAPNIGHGTVYASNASSFAELAASDGARLGPIVWQSCLKYANNGGDYAIAKIDGTFAPEILPDPAGTDSLTNQTYRLAKDSEPSSSHIANHDELVRFGAVSGVTRGSLGDPAEPLAIRLDGFQEDFNYSGLIRYSTDSASKPGDSGALVAVVLSRGTGLGYIPIAPVGIHIGADDNDLPLLYPLDAVFACGWEITYDG